MPQALQRRKIMHRNLSKNPVHGTLYKARMGSAREYSLTENSFLMHRDPCHIQAVQQEESPKTLNAARIGRVEQD
jgi:hypothetical protein